MAIDIEHVEEVGVERWDELVERSPNGTPFHRYGFLDVLADHSNATLHALVGYKGQEPVGLFPGFEIRKGPISTLFSPPPDMKIPYLGPVLLNQEKLKQRKAERRHRQFIAGCLETFETERAPRYVHVRTTPWYDDPRPFFWDSFTTTPGYTYHVDLTAGEDDLLQSFSSDARRNVRTATDADCAVHEGDGADVVAIITQLRERHREQGEHYGMTPALGRDLYQRLDDETIHPYVCTVDGEFVGGMVALEGGDTVYRWQGGAKTDVELPVNDYLDWSIMRNGIEHDLARYDLVGANNERLTRYKAKFNPRVETYLNLHRGTPLMELVAKLYSVVR